MPGEQINIESLNQIEMRAAVRSLIPTANGCHCVEKGQGAKGETDYRAASLPFILIYYSSGRVTTAVWYNRTQKTRTKFPVPHPR
jgi:hypothetical protein